MQAPVAPLRHKYSTRGYAGRHMLRVGGVLPGTVRRQEGDHSRSMRALLWTSVLAAAMAAPEGAATNTVTASSSQAQNAPFKSNNPALVVLDLACEHILGGGTCDLGFAKKTAGLQKQLNNDQRLQNTNTAKLCGLANSILAQRDMAEQEQHSAQAYCQVMLKRASTTIDPYRYSFDLSCCFDLR